MNKFKYTKYYQNCLQTLSILYPDENVLDKRDLMLSPVEVDDNTELEMMAINSNFKIKVKLDVPA